MIRRSHLHEGNWWKHMQKRLKKQTVFAWETRNQSVCFVARRIQSQIRPKKAQDFWYADRSSIYLHSFILQSVTKSLFENGISWNSVIANWVQTFAGLPFSSHLQTGRPRCGNWRWTIKEELSLSTTDQDFPTAIFRPQILKYLFKTICHHLQNSVILMNRATTQQMMEVKSA